MTADDKIITAFVHESAEPTRDEKTADCVDSKDKRVHIPSNSLKPYEKLPDVCQSVCQRYDVDVIIENQRSGMDDTSPSDPTDASKTRGELPSLQVNGVPVTPIKMTQVCFVVILAFILC